MNTNDFQFIDCRPCEDAALVLLLTSSNLFIRDFPEWAMLNLSGLEQVNQDFLSEDSYSYIFFVVLWRLAQ